MLYLQPLTNNITEYMVHGSLYDLLHNKTVIEVEGEQILPILQDISHGIRCKLF